MIIKGSDFQPAPEGIHSGICVDVVDLGIVETTFGKKHKLKVVWEIEATMDDGRRFIVQKRYNVSLHERSTLAADLKSWRGRAFTPDELKGFDMEKVIGAPCQLIIEHAENEGAVYANVTKVVKADSAKRLAASGNYTRMKDRPPEQQKGHQGGNGARTQDKEQPEEIPF